MTHKTINSRIVSFMVFQRLFFSGICSLHELMEFHPAVIHIDVQWDSGGCFTYFWSSFSASLLPTPRSDNSSWVYLLQFCCLFSSTRLLVCFFPPPSSAVWKLSPGRKPGLSQVSSHLFSFCQWWITVIWWLLFNVWKLVSNITISRFL